MDEVLNKKAQGLVEREVLANVSLMISRLQEADKFEPSECDNYRVNPDKLTLTQLKALLDDNGVNYSRVEFNPYQMSRDELAEWLEQYTVLTPVSTASAADLLPLVVAEVDQYRESYESELQDWQNHVSESVPDAEVYEWWLVSGYLWSQLQAAGEVVTQDFNHYIWGRQATGQALYLDSTFQELAKGLNR